MAVKHKTPELSRNAALAFSDKWKSYTDEKQDARGFWSDFFRTLCGVEDEEIAGIEYEKRVKSSTSGNQEYIDVYWKNVALIEHKSAGQNLDKAELQARGYWLSLAPGYRPKTIIISDFQNIRLIDVALNRTHEFPLSELPENIHRFEAIISGNRSRISDEEITVDQEAAELMANLYLELESHGFEGHETSVFLIRILFLLFGDDTGMWARKSFLKLVMETKEDGSNVGSQLDILFDVLNTPSEKRSKSLSENFKAFPYVNGGIFAEKIDVIDFNKRMRLALLESANYDWATINPTIFGSLFQLIKNKEARRELGEHYTSEENINKIVYPLFLDELQERLATAWDNKKELKKLRQDLAKIKIFDPACGCGNFLVVSYRHLRQLELELIVRLNFLEGRQDSMQLDGSMGLSITLNQFYGIEIEEWPAQVAQIALYLTEYQENLKFSRITGETPNRFPISKSANIFIENALTFDWDSAVDIDEHTYILGNPPFVGARYKSATQKEETEVIWRGVRGYGDVDYVSNWFLLASRKIVEKKCKAAFVATSSISQGEQPPIIWGQLNLEKIEIFFAHRSFVWGNESSDFAAVHCIIIGLAPYKSVGKKQLWVYDEGKGIPSLIEASNINGYLLDAPNILIHPRKTPLQLTTPRMDFGSMPNDGGYLSDITEEEAELIRKADVIASKYLRRLIGGRELIHNQLRYCLWLKDASASDIRQSKELYSRVGKVRKERLESKREATKKLASRPSEFGEIRQPLGPYIAVPLITSENREYLTVAVMEPNIIANNKIGIIAQEDFFTFAILSSRIFTVWNKSISGRLESRYNISITTTYNNFPFPRATDSQRSAVVESGKRLLKLRGEFKDVKLADLYDPISMPPSLKNAHLLNDELILNAYSLSAKSSENEILSKLFSMYQEETVDLLS
jgi:hypothetical protein